MERTRCLFGTDGVRDVANTGNMTPEMALRLGRSFVLFLSQRGAVRPRIVVGRDTRLSGPMLESAIIAGMSSTGAEVISLGILPTPAVSRAVKDFCAQGGVIISASHNPAEYNGIKFVSHKGEKLRDEDELCIEQMLEDDLVEDWRPGGAYIGSIYHEKSYDQSYGDVLLNILGEDRLKGLTVVFDCANGAATSTVQYMAERLEAKSIIIADTPNGLNINEKCGVTHLSTLSEKVKATGADFGIALDGDADRVLLVDRKGRELNGDIILWVLARWLKRRELLGSGVVATVMSNVALRNRLAEEDIDLFSCAVGDRYVLEMMRGTDCRLGGEQSGHVIIDAYSHTGDGLCTGLAFLRAVRELDLSLDSLVEAFVALPQKLVNISVANRDKVLKNEELKAKIDAENERLGTTGRVFLRGSGTEPLIRLLVECDDKDKLEELVARYQDLILSV